MLRDYQKTPVEMAIEYFRRPQDEIKPALIVLPTAWGKSWLAAYVADSIPDGESLLVLQPTKELLQQNYEKYITLCGDFMNAGVYSASMRKKNIGKITFATIGSIKQLGSTFKELGFTKMLIDEAHLYPRKEESMIGRFLSESGIRQVLGITATPIKMETVFSQKIVVKTDKLGDPILDVNGKPQVTKTFNGYSKQVILTNPSYDGMFYNEILYVGQIQEMVQSGFWSKLIYDKQHYDPKRLRLNQSGEYTKESVIDAYEFNHVHERIVGALAYYKERRHCIVFVPSVDEAERLAAEVPDSAFVSGKTPQKERDAIVSDFKAGKVRTVFNVGILSTGFDYPLIDMIILAFSTASISKYYQAIGRGVRIAPEKEDCLIVDMCGNLDKYGKIENLHYEKDGIWRLIGSNGNILTGIPVNVIGYYSKSDLARIRCARELPTHITLGKQYKGVAVAEAPSPYLQWLLKYIQNEYPDMGSLADSIRVVLENEIRDTTGEPPLERMPTGSHQGELMSEIPLGYLRWMIENTKWTKYNDSLKRGIQAALYAPRQGMFNF